MQVYDNTRVAAAPLPNVRIRPVRNEGLEQLAQGMGIASDTTGRITLRSQQVENADRIMRAENAIKTEYLAYDAEQRKRTGQNAWGLTDEVAKWWKDNAAKHVEGLENDAQRLVMEETLQTLQMQSLESYSKYEAGERRTSLEESAKASINSSINLAAADHNNPKSVATAKADVMNRVKVMSDLNGWTPEMRTAYESEYLTNFHKQVLSAKVDTDPVGAKAYYDANQSEIAGADRAQIEKALEVGGIKIRSQRAVDDILGKGLGRAGALNYARSHYEGAEEDAIIERLHGRYTEIDAVQQRGEKQAADQAWDLYARGGIEAIPASLESRVDGKTLLAIRRDAKAQAAGATIHTDWDVYEELRERIKTGHEVDIRQYGPDLGATERKELRTLQEGLKDPGTALDMTTLDQELADVHEQMEWSGAEAAAQRGQFDSLARERIQAEVNAKGKKLGAEERKKVIKDLLIEGTLKGGGWFGLGSSTKRVFEVTPDEADEFTPNVPPAERAKIEAALVRNNIPVTEEVIISYYKRKLGVQ